MDAISSYISEELTPRVKFYGAAIREDVKMAGKRVQDFYFKLTSQGPDGFQDSWIQQLRGNIYFQVFSVVFIAYAIYRWIYLPFLQDFLVAERCRFRLENTEPLKIGDNIIYTISGFLPPTQLSKTQLDIQTHRFFNALTAKVMLNNERISAMKAYADEDYGRIRMIFPAEKSGTYYMEIKYNGFVIPGSPLEIVVPSDLMSSAESEVKLPSVPVVLTDGMPQTLEIHPRDKTGNPCSGHGVRLDKFDFHASTEKPCCNATLCGKTCEIIGNNWKEGLDASFSYEGTPFGEDIMARHVVVLLNLRTNYSPNSYGIFEGQICYDGQIVRNGCFPIVSLSCDEYERLEKILKEPRRTDAIQFKAEMLQPITSIMVPAETNTCMETQTNANFEKNDPQMFIEWHLPPNEIKEISGYALTTKEVHVNISPKCVCIKEVVWTVLLSRIALFPIQGETKIAVVPETDEKLRYLITISDEVQNEIRMLMSASNTRMFIALYLKYRADASGSTLSSCIR